MRSLPRWLLLFILNAYILYTIFGVVTYVIIAQPFGGKEPWNTVSFGEFTFKQTFRNDSTFHFVGVSSLTPKRISDDGAIMLKDRNGKEISINREFPGTGLMMPVSQSQYRTLAFVHVAYSLFMICMFIYLLILLVQFTRSSTTPLFQNYRNGIRLRKIGTLLIILECIRVLFPVAMRFLPGIITGYSGLGVSLNFPVSTGLPDGIIAGLLLIVISDVFNKVND